MFRKRAFLILLILSLSLIIAFSIYAQAGFPFFTFRRPSGQIQVLRDAVTLVINHRLAEWKQLRAAAPGDKFYDKVGNEYIWTAEMADQLEAEIAEMEALITALQ